MAALTGLIVGSIISALISAGVSYATSSQNMQLQRETNAANLANQSAINQQNIDYSKEFAQNGIQWKMNDLEAAGLNPVLAAQGAFGGSSQPTAMQATQLKAPQMDLSGLTSAITAMNNTMLTTYLMSQRNDIQSDRNSVMREKNDVLNSLYKRKAEFLNPSKQNAYVANAKQIQKVANDPNWESKYESIMKELAKGQKAYSKKFRFW